MWLRLVRLRNTLAAALGLLAHTSVSETVKFRPLCPKLRYTAVLHALTFVFPGFCVRMIPWLIVMVVAAGIGIGATMLGIGNIFDKNRGPATLDGRLLGLIAIGAGFLLPCMAIGCCAWWKTPPRQSFYHDSLLDQMLSGMSVFLTYCVRALCLCVVCVLLSAEQKYERPCVCARARVCTCVRICTRVSVVIVICPFAWQVTSQPCTTLMARSTQRKAPSSC